MSSKRLHNLFETPTVKNCAIPVSSKFSVPVKLIRDKLLKAFSEILPQVLTETGCIEYEPVADSDEPGSLPKLSSETYIVIEKWERMIDLRAHASSDHMKAYAKETRLLIADRMVYVLI